MRDAYSQDPSMTPKRESFETIALWSSRRHSATESPEQHHKYIPLNLSLNSKRYYIIMLLTVSFPFQVT